MDLKIIFCNWHPPPPTHTHTHHHHHHHHHPPPQLLVSIYAYAIHVLYFRLHVITPLCSPDTSVYNMHYKTDRQTDRMTDKVTALWFCWSGLSADNTISIKQFRCNDDVFTPRKGAAMADWCSAVICLRLSVSIPWRWTPRSDWCTATPDIHWTLSLLWCMHWPGELKHKWRVIKLKWADSTLTALNASLK